jgi:hypothetical protein
MIQIIERMEEEEQVSDGKAKNRSLAMPRTVHSKSIKASRRLERGRGRFLCYAKKASVFSMLAEIHRH